MDWDSVLSAGIAVVGTLGGVAMTQHFSAKAATRDRHLALTQERDSRLRGAALDAARLFMREINETGKLRMDRSDPDVPAQMALIDGQLEARFHGPETSDLKLAVSLIPHVEARERLLAVLRTYASSLSVEGGLRGLHSSVVVPALLSAGYQISAAYARGEEPSPQELEKWRKFTAWPAGNVSAEPRPSAPSA